MSIKLDTLLCNRFQRSLIVEDLLIKTFYLFPAPLSLKLNAKVPYGGYFYGSFLGSPVCGYEGLGKRVRIKIIYFWKLEIIFKV